MSPPKVVAVHPRVPRRFKETSSLSHFEGTEEELLARVTQSLGNPTLVRPGQFEGSYVVEVEPQGFRSRKGAERTMNGLYKPQAGSAEVVLFSKETLGRVPADKRPSKKPLPEADLYIVALHGYLSRTNKVTGNA